MTWIKFICWTGGLYALYYLANIAWDLLRAGPAAKKDAAPELHFEEPHAPQKITADEPQDKKASEAAKALQKDPVISAIGGVNLKDLFNLAKAEVIAYNRAVSF